MTGVFHTTANEPLCGIVWRVCHDVIGQPICVEKIVTRLAVSTIIEVSRDYTATRAL
jgi:hypothetical protein